MGVSLRELADLTQGQLHGDGALEISGADIIRDVQPGQITLADQPKLAKQLAGCPAAAAVISASTPAPEIPHIVVENVHHAFSQIVAHFRPPRPQAKPGIHPSAVVSSSAQLGENVCVHPFAVIEDDVEIGDGCVIHSGAVIHAGCRLGRDVTLFPHAVLYENTLVGSRSIIHANAVLGAYGFGYHTEQGQHRLSAQLGYVEVGEDVEIGACSTVDRGTYGATVIGDGTKIDNQVMIAHNCRMGRHNLICSQVGVAGSSSTGDYVVMAGQVGVRDHVHIGDQVMLGAKAGVIGDIPAKQAYVGIPATPEREQMMQVVSVAKLPDLRKQVKAMQKTLNELTQQMQREEQKEAA